MCVCSCVADFAAFWSERVETKGANGYHLLRPLQDKNANQQLLLVCFHSPAPGAHSQWVGGGHIISMGAISRQVWCYWVGGVGWGGVQLISKAHSGLKLDEEMTALTRYRD